MLNPIRQNNRDLAWLFGLALVALFAARGLAGLVGR